MKTKKEDLQEKSQVGGGATGVSMIAEPTGVRSKAPGNSKDQGETSPHKLEGNVEETDSENNTKVTGDTSAQNKASVAMKEDMEAMFDGEQLSEQFKEKATTFFEAAVHARVQERIESLEEEYESKLNESLNEFAEDITAKIDEYMDYVVEEWFKENEVAIDSALRSEIAEDFINGLKDLFTEHYIDIPEEKVNVVEELAAQVEELQIKLNTSIEEQIELKKVIDEQTRQLVFSEVSEGLVATQVDKLLTLSEGVEFEDAESYKRKLETLKEGYFTGKRPSQLIVESEIDSAEPLEPSAAPVAPEVARYVSAISRTVKK